VTLTYYSCEKLLTHVLCSCWALYQCDWRTTLIYSFIYAIAWHFECSELHSQTQSSFTSSLSDMQQNILQKNPRPDCSDVSVGSVVSSYVSKKESEWSSSSSKCDSELEQTKELLYSLCSGTKCHCLLLYVSNNPVIIVKRRQIYVVCVDVSSLDI
jgi:hypothetical protein